MPYKHISKQPSTMVVDPSCKPQTYHGSSTWFLPKDEEWVLVTRKHHQKKKPTNSTKINKPTGAKTRHKTKTSTNKPHMDNKMHTKRSTMSKSNSSPRFKAHLGMVDLFVLVLLSICGLLVLELFCYAFWNCSVCVLLCFVI